jgi:hypothetical protein
MPPVDAGRPDMPSDAGDVPARVDAGPDGAAEVAERRSLWARSFGAVFYDTALAVAADVDGTMASAGFIDGEPPVRLGGEAEGGDIFVRRRGNLDSQTWTFGRGQRGAARALAFDGAGNLYVAGTLRGTADFGSGALTAAGAADAFIAKLGKDGKAVWARRLGSAGSDEAMAIACERATGEVVMAGSFEGTVDFGRGPLTSAGGRDLFVVRFSTGGDALWSWRAGGGERDEGRSVALDVTGGVLVAGGFRGTIDFGAGPLASAGDEDAVIVKLDRAGVVAWSRRFGGPGSDVANGVASDGQGNVALAGAFTGSVDFVGGALVSAGQRDLFVARLSPAGAPLWSKRGGGPGDDFALAIVAASGGALYVTGAFQGTAELGGPAITSKDSAHDAFVLSLAGDGSHVWSKPFGGSGRDGGNAIALRSGQPLVAGLFEAQVPNGNFGAQPQARNESDAFIALHDLMGRPTDVDVVSGPLGSHRGISIAAQPQGQVTVAAALGRGVDVGSGPLADTHVALLDLGGEGMQRSAKVVGDAPRVYVHRVRHDQAGNLFVSGVFAGTLDFNVGAAPLTSTGEHDLFVAKLTAGRAIWVRGIGGSKLEASNDLALDREGNVFVTGHFSGTSAFGGNPAPPRGFRDGFVIKLSDAGLPLWSKRFSAPDQVEGMALAVFGDGSVAVGGAFKREVDIGGTRFMGDATWFNGFLVKYSAAGVEQWASKLGEPTGPAPTPVPEHMVVDARNELAVAGAFRDEWRFGDRTWRPERIDSFVAKLTAAGQPLWSRGFGGSADDYATDLETSPEGTLLVLGAFEGTLDLGAGKLESMGNSDIYIVELRDPGTCIWSRRFGGPQFDQPSELAVDARSNLFLTGIIGDRIDLAGTPVGLKSDWSAFVLALGR